jgi:hypothetical protein
MEADHTAAVAEEALAHTRPADCIPNRPDTNHRNNHLKIAPMDIGPRHIDRAGTGPTMIAEVAQVPAQSDTVSTKAGAGPMHIARTKAATAVDIGCYPRPQERSSWHWKSGRHWRLPGPGSGSAIGQSQPYLYSPASDFLYIPPRRTQSRAKVTSKKAVEASGSFGNVLQHKLDACRDAAFVRAP